MNTRHLFAARLTFPRLTLAILSSLLTPRLAAQTTVTFVNGETNATAYNGSHLILSIASGTATQSGNLSNVDITKTGAGKLVLSGTNTYNAIVVNGGEFLSTDTSTLRLNSNSSVSGSGSLFTASGPLAVGSAGGSFVRLWASYDGRVTAPSITVDPNGGGAQLRVTDSARVDITGALTLLNSGGLTVLYGSTVSVGSLVINSTSSAGENVLLDAGTFEVGGTNGIVITAGEFKFRNGALRVINSNLTSSGNFKLDNHGSINTNGLNAALSGVISGVGALVKTGAGTLTLTGANTYQASGTGSSNNPSTVIEAGSLQIGDGGTTGSISGYVYNNANLTFNRSDAVVFSGTVAGPGSLTQAGAGTLTLTAANTHSGGTTVSTGTLQIGHAGATGSVTGNITNHGTVAFNRSDDYTFGGVISGTGGLAMNGTILRLSSAQTYTGPTLINTGILVLPSTLDQALAASPSVTIASGASLDISNRSLTLASLAGAGTVYSFGGSAGHLTVNTAANAPSTFSGTLGGGYAAFSLTKTGPGTLTLSGANTYSGGTTLTAGTLALSSSASLGSGAISVTGGTLSTTAILTHDRAVTVGGTGAAFNAGALYLGTGGPLTVTAGGSVTVADTLGIGTNAGANNTGSVTGTDARLTVGNKVLLGYSGSGALTIADGGVVAATEVIFAEAGGSGTLNLNSGGTLEVGGSQGIRTGASSTSFNLAGGTVKVTGSALTTSVPATLTNTSTINTNALAATFSGVLSGSGALDKTGAGTLTLSGANTYAGGTTVSTGTLAVSSLANLGSGAITVTSGTLAASNALHFDRTVSVSGNSSALTTGADLEVGRSGTGSLTLGDGATISVTTSMAFGANAGAVGTGSLTGAGSRLLTGATLYLGYLGTGSLTVASGATLVTPRLSFGEAGGSGTFTLNSGGTLEIGGTDGIARAGGATAFNLAGGTIKVTGSALTTSVPATLTNTSIVSTNALAATFSGALSGSGALEKSGTGTLTLSGANTFTGGTTLSAGTLALHHASALGSAGPITLGGGTLQFSSANTTDYSSRFSTAANQSYAFDTNGQNITLASALTSSGATLTKLGTGTLAVTAANTYTGGTTVSGGTLVIGNGVTSGSITGNVTNNASLAFDRSDAVTFAGTISGSGSLAKTGSGTLTLTGANTYTGGTTVSAGALTIGDGSTHGSLAGNITNHASLSFNRSDDVTFSGAITGSGSLTKTGSGNLILSGATAYSGGTTISAGTLTLTNESHRSLAGDIVNNGVLALSTLSGFALPGAISGTGSLTITDARYALSFGPSNTYSGGTTITGGIFTLNSYNPSAFFQRTLGTGPVLITGGRIEIPGGLYNPSLVITGGIVQDFSGYDFKLPQHTRIEGPNAELAVDRVRSLVSGMTLEIVGGGSLYVGSFFAPPR